MARGNQNQVQVTLKANDQITPQVNQIKKNIDNLGASAGRGARLKMLAGVSNDDLKALMGDIQAIKSTQVGQGGLLSATFFGNLGANAVMGAIGMVKQGFDSLKGSILSAAQTQTQSLAQAGDLATKLSVSFDKAKNLVQDTRVAIADMADALPGETEDFNRYASTISATIAGISGGDEKKYKERLLGLTEKYGVLGAIKGADAGIGASALNKAIGGSASLAELFTIELFARNTALMENIRAGAKTIGGGKDWKSLTSEQRYQILKEAGDKSLTADTLASFDGTVESMLQAAKTTFFNQDKGMFGALRKLKSMGDRSALDAVQGLFMALGSLNNTIAPMLSKMGLTFDRPMEAVITVIDWFTDLTNMVTGAFSGEGISSITDFLTNSVGYIFDGFNELLGKASTLLSAVDWGSIGEQVGFFIGNLFTKIFTKTDWGKVAQVIFKLLKGISDFLFGFLVGAIKGNLTEIGDAFKRIRDVVVGWVDKALGLFTQPITTAGKFVGGLVDSAPISGEAKELLKSAGSAGVTTGITSVLPSPLQLGIKAIQGITGGSPVTPLAQPKSSKDPKEVAFAPSVVVNGADTSNPQDLANRIMGAINEQYKMYQQNALA